MDQLSKVQEEEGTSWSKVREHKAPGSRASPETENQNMRKASGCWKTHSQVTAPPRMTWTVSKQFLNEGEVIPTGQTEKRVSKSLGKETPYHMQRTCLMWALGSCAIHNL